MHPRFTQTYADVIDLPGHCHRGAISVELSGGGLPFRVMSMHLSLSQPLRIVQMRIVGQYLRRRPPMQTVILGDLNEWRPWGGLALGRHTLGSEFYGPAVRSFPAHRPLLPLDRILTDRRGAVSDATALDHPMVRGASDHRPVMADVCLKPT